MNYNIRNCPKVFVNGKDFKKLNKLLNDLDNKFFFNGIHLKKVSYDKIKISICYIKEIEAISFITPSKFCAMEIYINPDIFSESEVNTIMNIFRKHCVTSTLHNINDFCKIKEVE